MLRALVALSLVVSAGSFACSGGNVKIGGKILLTSRTVSTSPTKEWDVNEMLQKGSAVLVNLDNGELAQVSVEAVKQDSEDITFTIFRVKNSHEPMKLIKVKSDYEGIGHRSGGGRYPVEDIAVDEEYGC